MPRRLQFQRRKGWTVKPAVVVIRPTIKKARLPMGRYGNPFEVEIFGQDLAVELFTVYAAQRLMVEPDWLAPLRGKDLACVCPLDVACHADVLLRLANRS